MTKTNHKAEGFASREMVERITEEVFPSAEGWSVWIRANFAEGGTGATVNISKRESRMPPRQIAYEDMAKHPGHDSDWWNRTLSGLRLGTKI